VVEYPLQGVKVLDLTTSIAGPYCTKLLSALGAEVIKVEKPGSGDVARTMGPFPCDVPDTEKSGLFLYLNTNKKSITLNIESKTGIAIFKKLVLDVDVLVENFEPKVMPELGLSYEILSKINPKIVMTSISNFGQNGPYKDFKASEITTFALSGLMDILGDSGKEPLKLGGSPGQYAAGVMGFTGTMAALLNSSQTGSGDYVDISILETLLCCHFQALAQYAYTGEILKRIRSMLICPCNDGFIGLTVQQTQWPRLQALIGMPQLLEDDRFKTMSSRRIHADELEAYVIPWTIERTKEEAYRLGQEAGLPIGYVATAKDLLRSEQYEFREYFIEIDHPVAGKLVYPGMPFKFSNCQCTQERAPLLGEHNKEIFCQRLGYSQKDLVKLTQQGVI
jgi:crotonobetainyl-CoA:carnitine CoA-transferase CaiB-like acyl-CoA transferase